MNPLSSYLMIGKLLALLAAIGIICGMNSQIHRAREALRHCNQAKAELQAELDRISSERNQQQIVTRDRFIVKDRIVHDGAVRAEKVETAPVVPGCKTPPQVMGADL